MSSMSPPGSIYSPNQSYGASYRYDESTEAPNSRIYPDLPDSTAPASSQQPIQQLTPKTHTKNASAGSSEPKARLRKACDSCSVRKVKCDESGPPCKSCAALDIPCTFERPSRRRGPPNRHAEAIKRQKIENGSYDPAIGSPTHDAAYSLAALAAPTQLSAESICDLSTLEILIDDYFIYIHPVIPLPHEPTFRAAFARREDKTDRSFLSLIATMMEALVASFPRRPLQLFTSEHSRQQFPSAAALIDRCHEVFIEARGLGNLDQKLNLNNAISSYLAGLASAYQFDVCRLNLYMAESVMMLRGLGFHRRDGPQPLHGGVSEMYGQVDTQRPASINYVYQESGRRLFWLCFVGSMSARQLDEADGDLFMPPVAYVELLPPLCLEIDDEYITEVAIYNQPPNIVSELCGFNLNVKVFRAFHTLAALEIAFGADSVYDWDRQRQVIKRALQNVKAATSDAPKELQLNQANDFGAWPPSSYDVSAYSHLFNGRQDPNSDALGLPPPNARRGSLALPYPRRAVQYEIQKANIYASQLATRSYLVERYWNLYELHDRMKVSPTSQFADRNVSVTSPTSQTFMHGGSETGFIPSFGQTPSDSQMDASEQAMAVERENIVRDMAVLLKSINQVNMEPNGLSFCNKIRQIASTLLETKRARMNIMPTLDNESVNNYLLVFLEILSKLERVGATRFRAGESNGAYGISRTAEEIEQEELVHWASLKDHQERFVRSEGFL